MKFLRLVRKIKDSILNLFDWSNDLIYLVETNIWSIHWDGVGIVNELCAQGRIKARLSITPVFLKNKILHFGSINVFAYYQNHIETLIKSNKIIVTWFHAKEDDPHFSLIPFLNTYAHRIHTSAESTKDVLVKQGLNEKLITVIPLGIDTDRFVPYSKEEKIQQRRKLGIPENVFVIGSFQKDGQGWDEGKKPKLIKGPDIFCDVVEKISQDHKIHILLTGPARSYVKNRLKAAGVPYTHSYLKHYYEIVSYYNALDLYIIASRIEGGPKAILESWATKIPLVSTKMGMPADVARDGENALLADVEDTEMLVKKASRLIDDPQLGEQLAEQAYKDVQNLRIEKIAKRYERELYDRVLDQTTH